MENTLTERGTRLRIGAVSYLNTKPLVYSLPTLAPDLQITFDVPSRLADDLHAGRLDIALIPSIEYLRDPGYAIVSNACIGCRGPVLSVKLLGRKPLRKIASLALDEGSRTSCLLARILLWERYHLQPRLEVLPIDCDFEDTAADAVLLIGDRAIRSPPRGFVECWDLGDQWCRWAELPFVFAMWVARPGIDATEIGDVLSRARDCGVAHLEEIARVEAASVGLSYEDTLGYLRDNLHFYFDGRERRGLGLFFQLARKTESLSAERDLQVR
jgi:chorismate dehydratase